MKVQRCEVGELAASVFDVIRPLAKKGVKLRNKISNMPVIEGDPDRLTQVESCFSAVFSRVVVERAREEERIVSGSFPTSLAHICLVCPATTDFPFLGCVSDVRFCL